DPAKHPRTPFSDHLLAELDALEKGLGKMYENYEFSQIAQALYGFVWDEFCARFIETAKADFADTSSPTRPGTLATADFVLSRILRYLHPYMPFITEELWLTLGLGQESIQFAGWPQTGEIRWDAPQAGKAEACYATAEAGRRLRGEFGLSGSPKLRYLLVAKTPPPPEDLRTLAKLLQCGLLDPAKETARLEKEIATAEAARSREAAKLADPGMASKAPSEKVEEWKRIEREAGEKIIRLREQLKLFTT
ncbi:MAG: hypothetical protein EBT68_06130, partial [Verrucomicrobia bacterium]|nr:hypothetical protein [Verrucomicrobiota bacterium]